MKRFFPVLIVLALYCSIGQAKNYYVSKGATGSGTQSSPYGTIAQAAKVATAGDTVFIAGGTYSEMNIIPKNSGSEAKGHIVFCPLPESGEVIISKDDNVSDDQNSTVFNLADKKYIWVQGLTFKDMAYLMSCLDMTRTTNSVVTGCRFLNLGNNQIAPQWGGNSLIWLYHSQDCIISNCYFKDIYGDGISYCGQDTKRNLICHNSFTGLKGKHRSWDGGNGLFSSSITGQDDSFGDNIMCFNHITGGSHGIWLDRDGSRSILVRNYGNGGQTLIFNESRCAENWIQENVAVNLTDAGYRSASYDGTNWSFDTRYINNVAYKCKFGFYIHKSKHNEMRNNIAYNNTSYNMVFTDSAYYYGGNELHNNFWYTQGKTNSILYRGKASSPSSLATTLKETGGIYTGIPGFILTTTDPSGFMLKETGKCVGTGDDGIDMGAYPLYKYADMGCDQTRVTSTYQPYIEKLVTEAVRGESYNIKVCLTKAFSETLTVRLVPVAGDAIKDVDYEMVDSILTFAPGETQKEVSINIIGDETDFGKLLLLRLCHNDSYTPFEGRSYAAFKIYTKEYYESLTNSDIYLEAEDGIVGSLWQTLSDTKASGGKYVTIKSGNNSSNSAPSTAAGWVDVKFNITRPTTYVLWLRTICPNANDDSFWLRLDDEEWSQWNGIPTSSAWQWNKCPRTFTMLEGEHTLHIGYREDGAKLDKLLFSCLGTIPEGMGGSTGVIALNEDYQEVISTTYYDLSGRQISPLSAKGLVIKRMKMKNGITISEKAYIR